VSGLIIVKKKFTDKSKYASICNKVENYSQRKTLPNFKTVSRKMFCYLKFNRAKNGRALFLKRIYEDVPIQPY
jgi:hypothetical protein